jgi:hypothetical protein
MLGMFCWRSNAVKWAAYLVFGFVPYCNAAALYSFGFNWVNTTVGHLSIPIERPHRVAVTLAGKVLLTDDDDHYSWYVVAAFPATGQARLVLLGSDSGNNWCPASHRVLEIKPDGKLILTSDFGDCAKHDAINMTSEAKIVALNNPKFVNGEWRIGLDRFAEDTKQVSRVWYIYKDGKVTLNDRTVANSQQLLVKP